MRIGALLLAAGQSNRFGRDKIRARLGGKPVWRWSFETFQTHPRISEIVLVCPDVAQFQLGANESGKVVQGGATRQDSCRIGLQNLDNCDIVLIHDAARPFVTADLINRVIDAAQTHGAAVPRVPVSDTIRTSDGHLLDRSQLFAMQTPQAASCADLARAHASASQVFTDDVALLQQLGIEPAWVDGDPANFKLTTADDLAKAQGVVGFKETRTGFGYDIHRFSQDPDRPLMIGGVRFDGPGLDGHSDADALLHAVVDALLGAAGFGDIGTHFSPDDPRWKDKPSTHFLKFAAELLAEAGWKLVNLDATVIAERPKIMPQSEEIRQTIASSLGCRADQVSIKATTNESLGSLGRAEGLAAHAVATITEA